MKKRNILLMFGLCAMLAFTACSSADEGKDDSQVEEADKEDKEEKEEKGLEGVWTTSMDVSEMMDTSEEAGEEEAEMVELFKDITLEMQLTFDKKNVKVEVTEASAKAFGEQIKNALIKYLDDYVAETAAQAGITVEQLYTLMEYDSRDAFINAMLEEMDMDSMVSQMTEELVSTGTYTKEDKVLKVTYDSEDDEESEGTEEWKYELNGDTLKITIKDDNGKEHELTCKRK